MSASILNGCLFCRHRTRITTFNINSKDFGCFNCSPTALKGLGLFQSFTHRTHRPWFVSCVHPPHSKDFVCFMCSPNALKGLCLSHVFTNRTQRTLLYLFTHGTQRTLFCFMCSQTALKGLGLFHVFTHRTQRTLFVACVHPTHSKGFVCLMCSQTALKGLCWLRWKSHTLYKIHRLNKATTHSAKLPHIIGAHSTLIARS
jgi:hypothetical protein